MNSPANLDLLPTEFEGELRDTVRRLLAERCDPTAVTAMHDGDRSIVAPLWTALAGDLGLAGLLVPDNLGGAGASAREMAAVLDELGRAVAPVPMLTSAVIATVAVVDTDSALVGELAAGERTAALAVPLSLPPDGDLPVLSVDAGGQVMGSVTSVAGAIEADVLIALVESDDGPALAVVEAADATVTPVVSLDMTRQLADVSFDGAAAVLLDGDGDAAVRRALLAGAALLASEQGGIARWCLEATVEYLGERKQFGRVVGSFQALKHRLADLYVDVESASAAAANAAAALAADDPDLAVAVAVAQSFCSDVAVRAAEEAIQLHGGIGMTWEHPAHLYLKRAKADQIALGTPGTHRAHLATLVDLPSGS